MIIPLRTSVSLVTVLCLAATAAIAQKPTAARFPQKTTNVKVYDGNISIKTVVPVISVETTGPNEINVGKTATFVVTVRNVGEAPAEGLVIRAELPPSVEFQDANPRPEAVEEDVIRFYVGDLPAKAVRQININLIPQRQGPVDLATRASFSASTTSSLRVRQSNLKIKAIAPPQALYGQSVSIKLLITNQGDGVAENVTIVPQLGEGAVDSEDAGEPKVLGSMAAGTSREVAYTLAALATGSMEVGFEAFDATGAKAETSTAFRVMRPMLNVNVEGPSMRYVNRPGDHTIRVTNPGDAPVENVEVIVALSPELRVTAIAKAAEFDSQSNTLTWNLPSVDPGSETLLPLKAIATSMGEHSYQIVATNNAGLAANAEKVIQAIGRPNIYATIMKDDAAIEVFQPANFTVLLVNRGTMPAEGVDVIIEMPEGLEPLQSDDVIVEGEMLRFDPLALEIGEQRELHFQAFSRVAGDHIIRMSYKTSEMSRALTMEGDAFVYDDDASTMEPPGELAERLDTVTEGPQLLIH